MDSVALMKPVDARDVIPAPKSASMKPIEAKAAVEVVKTSTSKPDVAKVAIKAAEPKEEVNKVAAMPRKVLPQATNTEKPALGSLEDHFKAAFAAFKVSLFI